MTFTRFGSLAPYGGPILHREIIANSTTVTVGDSVRFDTDGFIALSTAGDSVLGHVTGIGTDQGVGLNTDGSAGAEIGSFTNTFATASNNETVANVRAEVDMSQFTQYAADPASGTFGTTTAGSDEAGTYFDLSDEESIDETSVTDSTAQYFSWGINPVESNQIVVNIFESQPFNTA